MNLILIIILKQMKKVHVHVISVCGSQQGSSFEKESSRFNLPHVIVYHNYVSSIDSSLGWCYSQELEYYETQLLNSYSRITSDLCFTCVSHVDVPKFMCHFPNVCSCPHKRGP